MPKNAKIYVSLVIAAGLVGLAWAVSHWVSPSLSAYAVYLGIALILGATRLKLPGLKGTYSLSFLPVLYGLNHFTASEVLVAAALSAVAANVVRPKSRPTAVQILFNAANLTLSAGSCLMGYAILADLIPYLPATLCALVALYFAVNTVLVSGILSLVQGKPFATVCEAWYLWSFIYYLAGAAVMGLAMSSSGEIQPWVILLPIGYLIWFFWRLRSKPIVVQADGAGNSASMPQSAQRFVQGVILAGVAVLAVGLAQWSSLDPLRFAVCLSVGAVASAFKVRLPGMVGTISTSFVVILFAASELQWGETMAIAATAGAVQSYWKARRTPKATQVLFNVAALVLSSGAAFATCHGVAAISPVQLALLSSVLASTVVFYGCNSAFVGIVLGLIEHKRFASIWANCRFWSLPYYLLGTAASGLMVMVSRTSSYPAALLVLSVMALVFLAYRVHVTEAGLHPAVTA